MHTIGVISDTHGLLRPQACMALADVDHIVHAGDIGSAGVIENLRSIAPVTAVRGNNDRHPWASSIPRTAVVEISGRLIYVLHDLAELDLDPAAAGFAVVIAGHSHKPAITQQNGVLFLNPGSAGPRRFALPVAIAKLYLAPEAMRAEIEHLDLSPHGQPRAARQ